MCISVRRGKRGLGGVVLSGRKSLRKEEGAGFWGGIPLFAGLVKREWKRRTGVLCLE